MRTLWAGLGALGLLSTISGCSVFTAIANPRASQADVDAAKAKADVKELNAICTNTRNKSGIRNDSCKASMGYALENNDVETLDQMCAGEGPYKDWYNRSNACNASKRIKSQAQLAAFTSATCDQLAPMYKEHKRSLTDRRTLGKATADANFVAIAERMIACEQWDFVLENMAHWGQGSKGMGAMLQRSLWAKHDLEVQFLAYAQRHKKAFAFKHSNYFLQHYMDILLGDGETTKRPAACAKYSKVVERASNNAFPGLMRYMRVHKCKGAASTVAKQLASDNSYVRAAACRALGVIGDKRQHLRKLRTLGYTDQAVLTTTTGGVVTRRRYHVRQACQAAANKLAMQ